jgi:large subunit ribosomal protein L4
MTSVALLDPDGRATQAAELSPELASQEIKPHLIHETVLAELASRRAGTHSTKTRSQVRGGGKKPWRQKGTGRARQGSTRSPQWVGGGVVFGPQPRSYGGKVNKKVRAQAFRSALRAHTERGTVAVMDTLPWDGPSTKRAAAYLENAPEAFEARPLLVVVEDLDGPVARSFRNLTDVYVLDCWELETADVMAGRSLLVERAAWDRVAGGLGATTAVEPPSRPVKERPKRKVAPAKAVVEAPVEEATAVDAEEAPAEEASKPKRTRAKKAEVPADAEAAVETPAEETPAEEAPKPKRTRAKKAADDSPEAGAPVAELAAESAASEPADGGAEEGA